MSDNTLALMIDRLIKELAEIGSCVRTGMNLECCRFDAIEPPAGITPQERINALVLQRSGDTEHHNLLFVIGGPSMYAQHQILENRWVIMAAWADGIKAVSLYPEISPTHRDVITALELVA